MGHSRSSPSSFPGYILLLPPLDNPRTHLLSFRNSRHLGQQPRCALVHRMASCSVVRTHNSGGVPHGLCARPIPLQRTQPSASHAAGAVRAADCGGVGCDAVSVRPLRRGRQSTPHPLGGAASSCLLQLRHSRSHFGELLEPLGARPRRSGPHARRRGFAHFLQHHAAEADACAFRGSQHRLSVLLHIFRRDPDSGRPSPRHTGHRNLALCHRTAGILHCSCSGGAAAAGCARHRRSQLVAHFKASSARTA